MDWRFWKAKVVESVDQESSSDVKSLHYGSLDGLQTTSNPILVDTFDGEKTPGELGAVYDTLPDHLKLRLRAYDLNLKTDIVKIITGKFFKWVVGSGLKLQSEPDQNVLSIGGISADLATFQRNTESLFNLYAGSKYSDYHQNDWFHEKASEAFKAAFLGGDCLCVIRVEENGPNIQVIDGQQVETPVDEKGIAPGNVIRSGIELDKRGHHAAFWVTVVSDDSDISHKRIESTNSNGHLMAWMIYGNKERLDHHRGIPVISSIIEKIQKLDRFVEASVSKAEQTANVVYVFKHGSDSTGEDPLNVSSKKPSNDETCETTFEKTGRTAMAMQQTTPGMVINMPTDSEIVSLSSPSETSFNEFFRAVFTSLCASVDIPEEVALQKYEQNYSSSRAAINGWEHIVEIYRQKFAKKFYDPFYRVWLEQQILSEKIAAPGFLEAKNKGDIMSIEAYFKARFTGKKMPHIDPLKEAKAIRAMLGDDTTPLVSFEQATETLGAGDWQSNYKKYTEEKKLIPKEDDTTENDSK